MEKKQNTSNIINSCGGINDYASVRAIAISAGDMSVVVREEVKKILKQNKNNVLKSLYSGLEELVKRDLIFALECDKLKEVCKHLLYSLNGKEDSEEAFLAIRTIYHSMLIDQQSTPTALAVASVATSAFNLERESPLSITPGTTGAGAAAGAVIGAAIGGAVGGFLGAGIGAAIGGAAGAAIGLCNESGV